MKILKPTTRVIQTGTGVVTIMPARGIVVKCIHKEFDDEWGLWERETRWIRKLSGKEYETSGVIIMKYVGEPLNRENSPEDLEYQLNRIVKGLAKNNINHNDIQPDNLMVLDGTISLIDFGWATIKGDPIPDNWPKVLGGEFKGDNGFNDRESVEKVIKHIKGDRMLINHDLKMGDSVKQSLEKLENAVDGINMRISDKIPRGIFPVPATIYGPSVDDLLTKHMEKQHYTTPTGVKQSLEKLENAVDGIVANQGLKPAITVSVCMIVRDEDKNLKELLPQIAWADEMVIIDTKPDRDYTSRTGKSKESFVGAMPFWLKENWIKDFKGGIVFDVFPWTDDFAEARNFAKSKCTCDMILMLDADDRLPEETQSVLRSELNKGRDITKKTVHYLNVIMTQKGKTSGLRISQPRLFPNIPGIKWHGKVHETIGQSILHMKTVVTDIEIHHTGYEDPAMLEKKNDRNLELLLKSDPSPQVHMDLGNAYHGKGVFTQNKQFYEQALEEFQKALDFSSHRDEPFDSHIDYLMGISYSAMEDYRMSRVSFQKSNSVDSIYGEADAITNLGREEEGLQLYIKYLYTEPSEENFHGSNRYNLRSNAYKQVLKTIKDNYTDEYNIVEIKKPIVNQNIPQPPISTPIKEHG